MSQVLLESCPGQEIGKKALLNTYRQTELINLLANQLSFSPCYPKGNHPRLEKREVQGYHVDGEGGKSQETVGNLRLFQTRT